MVVDVVVVVVVVGGGPQTTLTCDKDEQHPQTLLYLGTAFCNGKTDSAQSGEGV